MKSLRKKLIFRSLILLVAVLLAFIGIFGVFSYTNYRTTVEEIKRLYREKLMTKGEALVHTKEELFKILVAEYSYDAVLEIVVKEVLDDEDVRFGGFVEAETFKAWVWFDEDDENYNKDGKVDFNNPAVKNEHTIWAEKLSGPSFYADEEEGSVERFPEIFRFALPIYLNDPDLEQIKPEKKGVLIYGFSTKNLNDDITKAQKQFFDNLVATIFTMSLFALVTIVLGMFSTFRQATTITQPLAILTSAADTIASGNYSISVEVTSGDEIEALAHSFNQMAEDLEMTYAELEDLNKHLEEKVEERTTQLRESEIKFRTLFEKSADAILLGDEEQFFDCNPAMLKMMGCRTKNELLVLHLGDISPENQPDGSLSNQKMHDIYEEIHREGSLQFEWVNCRVDGREFNTEIVITSFPLNGKPVLHTVFRDITERKKTEITLRYTQEQLLKTAHGAGMAEIATGVLHNIGNILNSVNISAEEISLTLKSSKMKGLLKANRLVQKHGDHLGEFFTTDPKGKLIPDYYISLGEAIEEEHSIMKEEILSLMDKISMMRDVISTQQSYAKATLYTEDIGLANLVEDALKLQIASLQKQGVRIHRDYDRDLTGSVPKVKLVHVLTNLVKNSKEAMAANEFHQKSQEMRIAVKRVEKGMAEISVADNGCGIEPENLDKIFSHGFTTKPNGHGFGLHTCANFMTEMGGTLSAESQGKDKGAVFILSFPLICKGPKQSDEAVSA